MKLRAALALACLVLPSIANAQSAISFTGGEATAGFPNRTLGYAFTVNSAIQIGQLGIWDMDGDGLLGSHQVGIWNSDGSSLLATATIPGGSGTTLIDGFRYVSVSPFALGPGQYLAGAFTGSAGDAVIRFTTATTIPEITLGSTRFDPFVNGGFSGVFSAPTGTQGNFFDSGYFGMNFRLANGVPEPSTWALLVIGFGLAGSVMRRRKTTFAYT